MVSKNDFKQAIVNIYTAHDKKITDPEWLNEVLRIWYAEMKDLTDKQFKGMVENMYYAPNISLYHFLRSLPDYQNEKNIKEYIQKRNEERVYGFKH